MCDGWRWNLDQQKAKPPAWPTDVGIVPPGHEGGSSHGQRILPPPQCPYSGVDAPGEQTLKLAALMDSERRVNLLRRPGWSLILRIIGQKHGSSSGGGNSFDNALKPHEILDKVVASQIVGAVVA